MSSNSPYSPKNSYLKLEDAIRSKSLTPITKALGELAERLGYQLKPPYTEVSNFKAKEVDEGFIVQFTAKLHLHYSSLERADEGLVIVIRFSGEALADSPTPPIHELFYAAVVDSLSVYGYGSRWPGAVTKTPSEYRENLEVTAGYLNQLQLAHVYQSLQ
jgi:hypothetical protein